jgi:hypothetical protein
MWYMPYLRVRRAVLVYSLVVVGITLAAIALRLWPGAVHLDDLQGRVHVALSQLIVGAASLVGGFATVLGLNLAAENDGHLEVAWTKPVSREGYALGVFAVDIGAMAVCIVFTTICLAVLAEVFTGSLTMTFEWGVPLARLVAFCGMPLCIYAWITAVSASLKRNRGVVAGLSWPFMLGLGLMTLLPIPAIHAVSETLNWVNPLAIYTWSTGADHGTLTADAGVSTLWTYLWGLALSALLLASALFQWRRLQL